MIGSADLRLSLGIHSVRTLQTFPTW
jgi:hypothetical protein